MSAPPVFIDLPLDDQAVELRVYLKSLGADISQEKSPKGIDDDLKSIIGVCSICFNESSETDVESILNAIVSMLVLIPPEQAEPLIIDFSNILTKTNEKVGPIALRVLWLLYQSLEEKSTLRYPVYYCLVLIAKQIDQIKGIFKDVDHLKKQFEYCQPTTEQWQKLYRLLHQTLLISKESEVAAKVMVELLGTYTTENAKDAQEDAKRCIVAAIADPETFLLDPLLSLKPVKSLENTKVYELLTIFVSGKLDNYMEFYNNNKEFVENLGLVHEENMTKMRLLTFMQLAEATTEMTFETVINELKINEESVEDFIIEVLKTKLVRARMDQSAKKIYIGSTIYRTFGRPQWQELQNILNTWKRNLINIQESMTVVASAQ